jgi:hypothetical protein
MTAGRILGAGAFGALLGILVGLSTQPVIVSVITVMLGLVGGALGIGLRMRGEDKGESNPLPTPDGPALAAFSLAFAILGVVGAWTRMHDVLATSPRAYSQLWYGDNGVGGITEAQAARLTVLRMLGRDGTRLVFPEAAQLLADAGANPSTKPETGSGFFAKKTSDCEALTGAYASREALEQRLETAATSEPAFQFVAEILGRMKALSLEEKQQLDVARVLLKQVCKSPRTPAAPQLDADAR